MKNTTLAQPVTKPTKKATLSLERYQGPWTQNEANHLLRRTTYGATIQDLKEVVSKGFDQTLEDVLTNQELPEPPINYSFPNDPNVPIGESWINTPFERQNNNLINSRRSSMGAWTVQNLLFNRISIREKMTLFWSNHFVVQASIVQDPNFMYYHNNLMRTHALGNFRTLVEEVTVDPAMLRYLNGNQNSVEAPNENYARELFELFTIGKGPLAGDGDYTTFTEEDVLAAAKILTGWRDTGYYYRDNNPAGATFINQRHDTSDKTLSHRFDNLTISDSGPEEYKILIDAILSKEETAKYICRKLYRWFVYYEIDEDIENSIITPLANIFRSSSYDVLPVLKTLLSSEHFFDIEAIGPMIKNPIDYIINPMIQFEFEFPEDKIELYEVTSRLTNVFANFGMQYYEPPNVAGWKAYYQEPLFYRTWISAATLPLRQEYIRVIVSGQAEIRNTKITMDTLNFISKLKFPDDPNELITELSQLLYPVALTRAQKDFFKSALIPGLPDFEWTVEYNKYLDNPNDEATARSVDAKLRQMLFVMLTLPEYHLS